MKKRKVSEEISLVPYFDNFEYTLNWYKDFDVCKQVDNIDFVYDIERLKKMYNYLNENGDLYYIEYKNKLVGDICLTNDSEITIVICKEYQNRHIGRKCVYEILKIAKEKSFKSVKANIYTFNEQSQKMFESVGFKKISDELYEIEL
ncbi:GNAT family N-acetyltransferase [Citroniella saccharovorans]|uniref:GNAT family N-acetyltransferase n=1 Tax=Citroniella saccharovorans TaxID=2053367 RepID=A0AAW9MP53_9FIRM|nr:GNAT family N-acetyltransferase [Citroniella saccharovorans]MEB3429308.1 GNAT family N-acetyltransferase [Citroniella saccharovorans]